MKRAYQYRLCSSGLIKTSAGFDLSKILDFPNFIEIFSEKYNNQTTAIKILVKEMKKISSELLDNYPSKEFKLVYESNPFISGDYLSYDDDTLTYQEERWEDGELLKVYITDESTTPSGKTDIPCYGSIFALDIIDYIFEAPKSLH